MSYQRQSLLLPLYMAPATSSAVPQGASGFLHVKGQEFGLYVRLPLSSSDPGEVRCCSSLAKLLIGYTEVVRRRLSTAESVDDFLAEIQSIVEGILQDADQGGTLVGNLDPSFYNALLGDLKTIGYENVHSTTGNVSRLIVKAKDVREREHLLSIDVPLDFPMSGAKASASFPDSFDFAPCTSLVDLYNAFCTRLDYYQSIWNAMDEIDAETWVLEPDACDRSAVFRRIAISRACSIHITVSMKDPSSMPIMVLMGADTETAVLRERLNTNFHLWSHEKSLLGNLQNILQVDFPSPRETSKDLFTNQCSVCFEYRTDDKIPDQACGSCGQVFHTTCILEWLQSLSTTRQSFGALHGDCPYCGKTMSVKVSKM